MKKITKKLIKLINFIIKILSRCVRVALAVIEEYNKAGSKVEAIGGIVVELGAMIEQLEEKKRKIEQLNEE